MWYVVLIVLIAGWLPGVRSAQAGILADLDGDGLVDTADLMRVLEGYGVSDRGDVDGDLATTARDVLWLACEWGRVILPTPTPTRTPSYTPTPSVTSTWTSTPTPTQTASFTPTPTLPAGITEQEPNDSDATAQPVGDLAVNGSLRINGRVSSGGVSGENYTGDLDFYRWQLPAGADLTISVEWSGAADLDAVVLYQGEVLGSRLGAERPITLGGTLSSGTFSVVVASKDQLADYQITLAAAPSTATYSNDASLLSGDYYLEGGGAGTTWYVFNGAGSYQLWYWTQPSGNYLWHSGTYEIWYPFLILRHDGETEYHVLSFESANVIRLDGDRYSRS